MSDLPLVLALHAQDIAAIAAVLLVWAAFRRLGRRRKRPGGGSRAAWRGGRRAPQARSPQRRRDGR